MPSTRSRLFSRFSLCAFVMVLWVLGALALHTISVHASPPGTWTATGNMTQARYRFSGVLLPSGKVLVASSGADLYDPTSGTFTATGSLLLGRTYFHAALLADGQVLAAGGNIGVNPTAEAELYNPATGTWSATGSLNLKRENYALAVLPNGDVLIAGGATAERFLGVTKTVEIYNPSTGTFTRANPMNVARQGATATLLPNGKVLVAGGSQFINADALTSAELFDPSTGLWTLTGNMNVRRAQHTATLLSVNDLVLVAGGGDGYQFYTNTAELYNSATGTWSLTGSMSTNRFGHASVQLPDGQVLAAGGQSTENLGCPPCGNLLSSAELYDPLSGTWIPAGNMNSVREYQFAILLPNGKVLEAGGGILTGGATASADLYQP